MARPGQITVTPVRVPSVLVVLDAAWPELFARCLGAAVRSGVLVHRCEVAAATTFAAEKRPLAIVLSNAVYDLDPDEFEALARDVRAALLKVDEEITERELEAMFAAALRERERRDDGGGSRYTLIGQVQTEETGPRSTRPPMSVRQTEAPPSARSMQLGGLRPSQAPPPDAPPPSARSMQLAGLRPSQAPAPPPRSSTTQPSFAAPAPPKPPPPSTRSATPVPGSVRAPLPPPPPPPSVRNGAAPPVPGSVRAPLPAPPRSTTPTPGSLPPPPSVRGAQLASPAGPPASVPRPQGPVSVRSPQLAKAAPTDPRSGVRYGGDALDAVFDDQDLPNGTRVRGGS